MTNDTMLKSLLTYHQQLIGDDFIHQLMNKIDTAYKRRQWILGICSILGIIFGYVGLQTIWPQQWLLLQYLPDNSFYILETIAIVSVGCVLTWVFKDEFEHG